MSRILKAGTVIHLAGSSLPLTLPLDTSVEGIESDAAFVGRLIRNRTNFELNAPFVGNGRWNPHTGAGMLNECACGREIPADAEDQETCSQCLNVARIEAVQAESAAAPVAAKKKAPAKRSKTAKKGK